MFLKKKSNVMFRNHRSFGYITDNRNFGYKTLNVGNNYIGDKILSESGAVFFSVLSKKPQNIDELVAKINEQFEGVDVEVIKSDAKEFYSILERDGFVVSGDTLQECEEKDIRFSYNTLEQETFERDFTPDIVFPEKSTQDFLEEHFKGKPQLTNLHIEITSRCNERCVHCYIPHENKLSSIDDELFYDVLKQCREIRLLHLTLSGGEPLLHKSFCNFLRRCREYDFSVNVLSNLTLLNDDIVKEMRKNPLLGVQVSLYSMNPKIHDDITRLDGSFYKTKQAILRLIENDIPLQISCPIVKQNKRCYNDVIKWAKDNKIHAGEDYVIIARYNNTTENLDCRLSVDEIKEVMRDKSSNNEEYFERLRTESEKKQNSTPSDFVCSVCNSSICIAENGNVYPCAGWQNYVVGNVKDMALNEIWNNSEKVQYLRKLRNHDFPKCINCADKDFCTMCMVRNANENSRGNPLVINDFFCNIAKFNKQLLLERERKSIGF